MIGARDMIAIKILSNAAAIKILTGIKAGMVDMAELATACGISVAYTRLLLGKLIANGFITASRATDLTSAKVTVVEFLDRLIPGMDGEVRKESAKLLKKQKNLTKEH